MNTRLLGIASRGDTVFLQVANQVSAEMFMCIKHEVARFAKDLPVYVVLLPIGIKIASCGTNETADAPPAADNADQR